MYCNLKLFLSEFLFLRIFRKTSSSSEIQEMICNEISNFSDWCEKNKQYHNQEKSQLMIFSRKQITFQQPLPINIQKSMKILGVILNDRLTWHDHVDAICNKASKRLYILRALKPLVAVEELHQIYTSVVRAIFDYACVLFVGLEVGLSNKLQRIDRRAHRIISYEKKICECEGDSLSLRREVLSMTLLQKIIDCKDHILHDCLPSALPHRDRLSNFYCRTERRQRSFFPYTVLRWNERRN